jgi:O-antigen/teichoic acid export membrane protein
MSETKVVAKNTIIQIIGKIISTIFGILTVAVLARLLGPVGYGQLTLVLGFLAIFATLVDFGLTLTTTQLISEQPAHQNQILSAIMSLRLISALIFLSLAPVFALFFPYDTVIVIGIAISAFSYFIASGSQVLVGVFQKHLDMTRPILAEIINRASVLVGAAILGLFTTNLLAILWLFVVGNFLQLLMIISGAFKYSSFTPKIDIALWKEIISRSWPIGASIFFNLIYLKGDIVFLSFFRDEIEIGYYGMAYKILEVLASVPVMFMGLILPILVASWSAGDKARFKKIMQQAFDFFAITALPIAAGSALVGTKLITLVAGAEYAPAGPVLYLLGPTLIFVFFGSLYGHAIVGLNKQKPMTWGYFAVAVITVFGYIYHIPIYGMYGAAFWTLISEALITIITFTVVVRVSSMFPNLRNLLQAIFATLVMSIFILLTPNLPVLITVAASMIIYSAVLMVSGGPNLKHIYKLFSADKPPIIQG